MDHILIILLCIFVFIIIQCLISVSNYKYHESLLHLYKVTILYKIYYSESNVKEYIKEINVKNTSKDDIEVLTRAHEGVNKLLIYWNYYGPSDKSEIKVEETTAPIELVNFSIEEIEKEENKK